MVRKYQDSDFSDVSFLNESSYEKPCTESELRAKLANPAWVWESDAVLGCLITSPDTEARDILDRGRILVWSVTVAAPFRGQGIGAALLREASKHFLAVYLYVEYKSPAIHLYTREGFKPEKLLYEYYGPNQHAYLMRKGCRINDVDVRTEDRQAFA